MTEIIRALSYRVAWAHDLDYERAPRVQVKTNGFDLDLFGHELRATLNRECFTIEQARTQVEDYLHGWEILIGISEHPDAVHFKYESAEVEEVGPDLEARNHVRQGKVHVEISTSQKAVPHVSRGKYPAPPNAFHADSVVEAMYSRYSRYVARRELLTSMAYFCLTTLEQSAGGHSRRARAATKYGIDLSVLNCLGELCSTRGSVDEARKALDGLVYTQLSQDEGKWVEETVKLLMRRAGEIAACPEKPFVEITMQDLPALNISCNASPRCP